MTSISLRLAAGAVLLVGWSAVAPDRPASVAEAVPAPSAVVGVEAPGPAQSAVGTEDFETMMDVLTHPRCVNCHPAVDAPRIGDAGGTPHDFGVRRGSDNHGLPALRCSSCHQAENNDMAGVPGAPEWSLAPRSMAWEGKSRAEIARSMLNPANNGGRTLQEVVDHLTHHELVLWAWEPGVRADGTPREPPPVDVDTYIAAVRAWAADGAPIPDEGGPP